MAETSLTSGHEPSINSRRNWRSVYIKCGADNVTVAGATRVSLPTNNERIGRAEISRDRFYRYRLYFLFLSLFSSVFFFFSNQRYPPRDDSVGYYREEVPSDA